MTDHVNNMVMDLNTVMILMRGWLIKIGILILFKLVQGLNHNLIYESEGNTLKMANL